MRKLSWLCGLTALLGAGCSSTSTNVQKSDGGAGGVSSGGTTGDSGAGGQAAGGSAGVAGSPSSGGSAGQLTGGTSGSGGQGCSTPLADCVGDSCPIEELYADLGTISSLTVAANQIYFTHGAGTRSELVRAPKAGGCPEVMVSDLAGAGSVRELLNDTNSVWIATNELGRQVMRVDKATFEVKVLVDGGFCDAPRPLIAQNDTRLFFVCGSSGGFLGRLEKLGGSPAVHLDPPQALAVTSLAASDNWLFWADGALIRVDTTDGSTTGTVTNVADIARVAVGLSGVYAQRTTDVWRTAPDGSNPELFIPNLTAVSNLAAQAGLVIVSDNKGSQGAERVVGRGEQLPSERIYATAEGRVTAVSADAKYVYWADTASGSIRRRAR